MALGGDQLKCGIVRRDLRERFERCVWLDRKKPLDGTPIVRQIELEDFRFFCIRQRAQTELSPRSPFQCDLSGSFCILYPLSMAARRDKKLLAIRLQKIDRSGIGFA